jgi:hypothetical protein
MPSNFRRASISEVREPKLNTGEIKHAKNLYFLARNVIDLMMENLRTWSN